MKHATLFAIVLTVLAFITPVTLADTGSGCPFTKAAIASGTSGELTNPQTVCPIMGEPIDKSVFEDADGYRVYFCCASCKDKFNQDPKGIIQKMQDEGITLEKTITCQGKANCTKVCASANCAKTCAKSGSANCAKTCAKSGSANCAKTCTKSGSANCAKTCAKPCKVDDQKDE